MEVLFAPDLVFVGGFDLPPEPAKVHFTSDWLTQPRSEWLTPPPDPPEIAYNRTGSNRGGRTSFTSEWFAPSDPEMTPVFENQIIITKVVAMLSAMGSAYIFISTIVDVHRQKKLDRTFDRL